jgi:hypothetical protein
MDPDVAALLRQAACDLDLLLRAIDDEPADWEARAGLLVTLEQVASHLVDAARLYAEQLSREAGEGRATGPDQ